MCEKCGGAKGRCRDPGMPGHLREVEAHCETCTPRGKPGRPCSRRGSSAKGARHYPHGELSYLDLQKELPFPTKMIVLPLPGAVLQAAIAHSRGGEASLEKRGYLQVDGGVVIDEACPGSTILAVAGEPFDPQRSYLVGLPRNLLKGIFHIQPLVEFAEAHPEAIGDDDAFVPAFNLVIQRQAQRIWARLGSFEALDANGDGELSREEIALGLEAKLGVAPSAVLVDNVIRAIDANSDGKVSRTEYEQRQAAPLKPNR